MLKNNKGITLVSLVITIIVLVILASVATISGKGAIEYIKFNNAKAQFQNMQAHVNSWYEEYKEVAEDKKEDWLKNYGVPVNDPSCDQEKAGLTATPVGGDLTGYRYFSSTYIKDTLDIDGISYDFLINISSRKVLLFGGINYNDKTYYSAEDFGINIVDYKEPEGNITFNKTIEYKDNKAYLVLSNIRIDGNISKYEVKYQINGENSWTTATSNMRDAAGSWRIPVKIGKTYNVEVITEASKVKNSYSREIPTHIAYLIETGEAATEKLSIKDENNDIITVPEGFKIASDSAIQIKNGVVVVAPDGSEFVWVPVKEPIYNSENENVSKIPVSTTEGTLNGYTYTPMAIEVDGEYKSLLYNFDSTGGAYLRYGDNENYQGTTAGYTEPEALSDSTDGDYVIDDETKGIALLKSIIKLEGTDDEIKEQWESQLQNEFNEMINSVHQNKGFYIGRYETSLNELNNAQSKAGNKPASGSASSAKTWYGLYQKTKEYSSKNNLTDFIGSSMTYGNQYDQMMIWFINNNIDVTLESPINEEGITVVRNPTINKITGPSEDNSWYDKINNIYDLLGGMREWSIQAYKYKYRVTLGGYCTNVDESIYRLTSRTSFSPAYSGSDKISTRITLYVK